MKKMLSLIVLISSSIGAMERASTKTKLKEALHGEKYTQIQKFLDYGISLVGNNVE